VLAKLYGAAVLGGLGLAMAVYSIFSLPGAQGARDAIVRFTAESIRESGLWSLRLTRQRLLLIFTLSATVSGIILFFCAEPLAEYLFEKQELASAFRIMAFALPFGAITLTSGSILRGLKRMTEASLVSQILPVTLNLVLITVFAFKLSRTTESAVYAYLLSMALAAVAGTFILSRSTKKYPDHINRGAPPFPRIISIAAPMLISSGMIMIFSCADTIMLGMFRTNEEVGVYRMAFKISTLATFSLMAVGGIAAAQFAEAHTAGNKEKLRHLVAHSAALIFWTTLPVVILLVLFASPILGIFGRQFQSGTLCLVILVLAQGFNAMCGLIDSLLNICGGHRQFRNAILATSVLNIVLNFVLIRRYGINGAAMATAASIVIGNLLASLAAWRLFGFWAGFRFR